MLTALDFDADQADRTFAITIPGVRRLGVAFSGGVDSSVLLALAVRALGHESVIAILGVSPVSPTTSVVRLTTLRRTSGWKSLK